MLGDRDLKVGCPVIVCEDLEQWIGGDRDQASVDRHRDADRRQRAVERFRGVGSACDSARSGVCPDQRLRLEREMRDTGFRNKVDQRQPDMPGSRAAIVARIAEAARSRLSTVVQFMPLPFGCERGLSGGDLDRIVTSSDNTAMSSSSGKRTASTRRNSSADLVHRPGWLDAPPSTVDSDDHAASPYFEHAVLPQHRRSRSRAKRGRSSRSRSAVLRWPPVWVGRRAVFSVARSCRSRSPVGKSCSRSPLASNASVRFEMASESLSERPCSQRSGLPTRLAGGVAQADRRESGRLSFEADS